MDYKSLGEFDEQDQTLTYFFNEPDEMFDSPNQIIDLQELINIYENIQRYYLNHEDLEALILINSLDVFKIVNNPDAFSIFEVNNIPTILLQYASNEFEFKFNSISIEKIIDFTTSNDDRYKDKFINLSIFDRIKHYFDKYNVLSPFAILEISYICAYKQSLEYFNYLKFDIENFFVFLLQSCGVNHFVFMKSFEIFVQFYDPVIYTNEISQILNGIDNIIQKFPIDKLQLYGGLFKYVCELTTFDFFDDLIHRTDFVQHLINLLYSLENIIDTPNKEDFLVYLFSLICYFTQDPNCPEIKSAFLFNFFDNFKDPKITSFILCIIGNIYQYRFTGSQELDNVFRTSLIQSTKENDFLKKLKILIDDENSYRKMEALICFSKIFSFSPKSIQNEIIANSGINILEFIQVLVDSLSYSTYHTCFDRLLTILNILELAHNIFDYENYIFFVDEADVHEIFQLQFEEDEEAEMAEKIKLFLDETCNSDNSN